MKKEIKVIVAVSRSSRYGRPKHIAFGTMSQSSVEMAMSAMEPRGRYNLRFGKLILEGEK